MRNFSAVIGHGSWAQAWQTSVHVRTRDWNGACDERARMFPSMSARAASLFSSRAASMAALLEARRTSRRMGMSGRDAASSGSAGPSPRGRSVVDVGIITVAGRGSCPPAGTKLMCVGIITVAGGLGGRQISRRHAWEGSPINGRLEPLRFGRK